ncbi:hypothetical protein CL614_10625 [archaeon]|nr:hypothetical protein [archaeon]|tara:strand:+ start:1760 stop:2011 length:252 start_codon:yes stop_codon:yes gene_type:complete
MHSHGFSVEPETLMRQAWKTAEEWSDRAIEYYDSQFGEGYSKEHPEMISAFLNACALDQIAGWLATYDRVGLEVKVSSSGVIE